MREGQAMTYHPKSEFIRVMIERGFLADCTDYQGLDEALAKGGVPGYIGFDATAKSLHVGSLIQIMMLRWLQKTGHKPITLMGGGTTKVGDPSFRADERPLLTSDQIDANIAGIKRVFSAYVSYGDGPSDALMINNAEWLDGLNYLDFLRDIGRHFSVNRMLSFESVKSRLDREQSLSFLEFNYMILQAYDFLELNKKEKCMLQIGGSDQWGNIINGVDLIKRYSNNHVYGLTTPLITLASGAKMGKTESGAVWLDKKFLSAYDYWQFWRNIDDRDVLKFLKIFTDINIDEIENIKDDNINELKILLANKATSMLHGEDEAKKSQETAKQTFSKNSLGVNLPTIQINKKMLGNNISILDLVILSKLESSKSEIRRLIKGNGIKINSQTISDAKFLVTEDLFKDNLIKLSLGKKKTY